MSSPSDIYFQFLPYIYFASKLHINDRLGKFEKKNAYILFKDHKPNYI